MGIRAIHNHIIFQFIDRVNAKGEFEEQQSKGGIILKGNFDQSAKNPRWARIVSVGPKCSEFLKVEKPEILIDNLKWTIGVKYEGETYWRTDEDHVLCYRPTELTMET